MKDYEPDRQLKQYLLGTLPPDQQERLEEQLLTDGAYVEQLAIVEEELLDSYVSQELSAQEREHFETYFLVTPERQQKLRTARALRKYVARLAPEPAPEPAPGFLTLLQQWMRQPSWSVAVPALLVVFIGVFAWRVFFSQSELDKGLAALNAAYREQRPVESRIASFGYAPFIVTRGESAPQADAIKVKLAERILLDQADQLKNAAAFYALGKLHLSHRKFDEAIQQFEAALKTDPNNAQLHNDLAAALMEKALLEHAQPNAGQSVETFAQSREHLEKALQLDSRSLDARFNLALWQQRQGLWAQAEESWQKYLEQDPRSRWADDARQYLKEASERKTQVSKTKEQLLKEFLQAHQDNDPDQAWRVLSQNREAISEKLIWWLLTDELLKPSSDYSAEQLLKALTFAGNLEAERADDHFTAALAKYYRGLSPQRRNALSQAHQLIKQGHKSMLKTEYANAIEYYGQAQKTYTEEKNGTEGLALAPLLSQCYFLVSKTADSAALLSFLIPHCQERKYQWLLAQALSAIGPIHTRENRYSQAIEDTKKSLEIAQKIDDVWGQQKSLTQLANQYSYLGDQTQAITYLQQCQPLAAAFLPGDLQRWRGFIIMAETLNALRFSAAAIDYLKAALALAEKPNNPDQLYLSYARLGNLYGKLPNLDLAIQYANQGLLIAQSPANKAYAALQLGNLQRQSGNYLAALAQYHAALVLYQSGDQQARILDIHKGLFLCYLAEKNMVQAQNELDLSLTQVGKYRTKIQAEQQRNTFFDVGQSLYDMAIDFAYLYKGDLRVAFDYAEASRARSLLSAIYPDKLPYKSLEIQPGLLDDEQLVQYAVLEDRLFIWVITKSEFQAVVQNIKLDDLQSQVRSYQQLVANASSDEAELRRKATELYQLLILPIEPLLKRDKWLRISPDKILCYLPFVTLVSPSSATYLLQDFRLTYAPSATIYLLNSEAGRQRQTDQPEELLSVGNPDFDRSKFPQLQALPAANQEATQVARLYGGQPLLEENAREAQVKQLLRNAHVVHLASHYVVNEKFPLESQLLLTKEPANQSEDGALRGEDISRQSLPHVRMVVLSACRSGVERYYNGEGMIGFSRAFLAAGVPQVVASLWPVDSQATAELMINFHRHRKQAGKNTAEALRQAQLEMAQGPRSQYQRPYYWAAFIAIGGHTNY